jgi:hypothetical protein
MKSCKNYNKLLLSDSLEPMMNYDKIDANSI